MKLLIIFITVIILILGYILILQKKEFFGDIVSVKQIPDILDLKQQFDDLIVYDNDADGRIGLDKCIENCHGYCVEFGQTGSAYCYPVKEHIPKDFTGGIVQNEQKLAFPNI
jgi:hypothetical protein